jgi:hypothetical protein
LCGKSLERALNAEDGSLPGDKRTAIIESAVRDVGLPFLESCKDIEGIRRMFRAGNLDDALVFKEVRTLAGIPPLE